MNTDGISCCSCNNTSCLVRNCDESNWNSIIDLSKQQKWYRKGEQIIWEGDPVEGLHFIQQGGVKVTSRGLNGKEQIIRLAGKGHILGHRGLGNEKYPIGAVALEDTQVCFIRDNILNDAFLANPKFTYELMMFYSTELRNAENRMKYVAQMNILEKIAEALLYISNVFGINPHSKSLAIDLKRQEIADVAGTNAEQVTRHLTIFEQQKLIHKRGKAIQILKPEGLQQLISRFPNPVFNYS